MKIKPIIAALGLAVVATPAMADLKANIGVASNYIWRGVTQSADAAAVSGGVDYTHQSGFYAGTWVSNTTANQYEHDIYGGYNFKAGQVDMDAGLIRYIYPIGSTGDNFNEIYLNAKYQQFGGGVALTLTKDHTSDKHDVYLYGSADFELKKDLTLNLLIGNYNYDAPNNATYTDYTHFHASLHKDDFSIAWDKNDLSGAAGDPRISVTWSKSLDL